MTEEKNQEKEAKKKAFFQCPNREECFNMIARAT
jgi:hypothetical protein